MKLINGELRPGTILEVLSPEGVIKASVPGLFSAEDMEVLPPIYPFCMGGSNTYSTPNKGDEVWVLFFTDNMQQLFWFRKDNYALNNGKLAGDIQQKQNVEVLSNRESGTGAATIYFSDGTGWIIRNQEVVIQLDNEGNITLTNGQPHGTIEISSDGISLGTKGGSAHPACHGDKVAELFDKLIDCLSNIAQVAKGNPYTYAIGTVLEMEITKFENDPDYINSDVVTLD
jgi:hypothetical protein